MRIALAITHFDDLGGAQAHVAALARAFAAQGDQVLVLHGGAGAAAPLLAGPGVVVRSVPALLRQVAPAADLRAVWALRSAIRAFRPDVVHAHSTKAIFYAGAAARSLGVPSIATAHGWVALLTPPFSPAARPAVAAAFRIGMAASEYVVCLSDHDLRVARDSRVAPGRLVHVPIGIADCAAQARPEAAGPRLVTVARHYPQKDATTLVRALDALRTLPWELDWFGGGPELERTRRQLTALGLQDRVRLRGDDPSVPGVLAESAVFVLATHAEGLPIAILEAMRAGLPIVASDVGAVGEAISGVGTLVPPASPAALADALRTLLLDPALRVERGAAARARYAAHYREEPMLDALRQVYRSAARSR